MKTLFPFLAVVMLLSPAYAFVDFYSPFLPDEHTLGLWHFDEQPSATTVKDSSGNTNDGTLLTDFANKLDPNKTWKKSMLGFGNCAFTCSDNTSGNYNMGVIQIDQDADHNTLAIASGSDFSIEFWMNPDPSVTKVKKIILQKFSGSDYTVYYGDNKIGIHWYGGGAWCSQADVTNIAPNNWTHVAITIDRTTHKKEHIITFYINGVLSSSHETPHLVGNPNVEDAWILNRQDSHLSYNYLGKLDELRISNIIRPYPSSKAGGFTSADGKKESTKPDSLRLILFK